MRNDQINEIKRRKLTIDYNASHIQREVSHTHKSFYLYCERMRISLFSMDCEVANIFIPQRQIQIVTRTKS